MQHYLLDGIQEVYRSQGVSINDKHIETILRKVAPVNRVRVIEEGDSSFVSGELVWKEDLEQGIEAIREENAKSLDESYEFVSGYKIIDVPSVTGKSQEPAAEGITRGALSSILQPGGAAGEIIAEDERGELKIIIGDASFRRAIEGF